MNLHLYNVTGDGSALGSVSVVLARDSKHARRLHKEATFFDAYAAKRIKSNVKIFDNDVMQEEMVLYSWNGDY